MSVAIHVVVADDRPLVRTGLRATLARSGDIEVVGEARDAAQVWRIVQRTAPDVLLVALGLPGAPLAQVLTRVRALAPSVGPLVLLDHQPVDIDVLVSAGAAGCMLAGEACDQASRAVRTIARGMTWFSQPVMAGLARARTSHRVVLTDRESQVLRLVAQGWTNRRIGHELGIAERTVRYHLENAFGRLEAENRLAAVMAAQRLGLLSMGDSASA
jgi:DNA-binding NarL/FixJ family response regulator